MNMKTINKLLGSLFLIFFLLGCDEDFSDSTDFAWFFPMMILLIGISNLIVIFVGGNKYIIGEIELGILAEFIIYVNMLTFL